MHSREIIKALHLHGFEVAQRGSHKQFRHSTRPGRTTVPHPVKDVPAPTVRSIERQSGVKVRDDQGRAAMTKLSYPAILHKADSGGYGVVFPDLDGGVSFGDSAPEAIRDAEDALLLHLEGMVEDGHEAPRPDFKRNFSESDGGLEPGALVAVVTVEAPDAGVAAARA